MNIEESKICNKMSLRQLEKYLALDEGMLNAYYEELSDDHTFLTKLNEQKSYIKEQFGFCKGLFGVDDFDCVDWYAFERILMYVLVRHLQPNHVLETGVYYGGNTAFILNAMHKNGKGHLISIDYPASTIAKTVDNLRHPEVGDSEQYESDLTPGFLVPDYLRKSWELIIGDSHQVIPKLDKVFDIYLHDSEHSYDFVCKEIELAQKLLSPSGLIIVDDIDWSNGFYNHCCLHALYPLLLTDNGKDELRVRTGLVALDHPKNKLSSYVG